MTEADRLNKIIDAQAKEIRRLRKTMEAARVCRIEYGIDGNVLSIVITAIGIDEAGFTEAAKPQLMAVAEAIATGAKATEQSGGEVSRAGVTLEEELQVPVEGDAQ